MKTPKLHKLSRDPVGTWLRGWIFAGGLLSGVAVGVLCLAFALAGDVYEFQDTVDGAVLPSVDAIVCLAGGKGRIGSAADVWFRYRELAERGATTGVPVLYFSGVDHTATPRTIERHVRRGVWESLKPENMVLERESENTESNAWLAARAAKEHGWKRILLMTSPYHMKRARLIFEKIFRAEGLSTVIETLKVFQYPFEAGEWRTEWVGIRVTLIEYFKALYYRRFWNPS